MLDSDVFDMVMENDPNIVVIKDENSVVLYANKALLDLVAPDQRGSVVGSTLAENFSPEEASLFLMEDRRALERGRTEIVERIVDPSGRARVFLARKIAFSTGKGERRILAIATDITELSLRERSLIEANDRLKRLGAFAAHDLRSPLATFVSALTMIRTDAKTTLGPQAGEYVDLMIASASNLADNVTAMLSVAEVDDAAAANFVDSDLNLLFEEVRFNLSNLILRSGATISAARLPRIVCEPGLVRQLLQNLVENSIKNRSQEPLHVLIRYERTGCRHRLFVEDNGVGVSPEAARTIFDAFDQGGRSSSQGVGIGLTLCRRIVDIHAGQIGVDTSFETGCRVEVVLPVDPHAAHDARLAA